MVSNYNLTRKLILILSLFLVVTACEDDDNSLNANITVNEGPIGDIGGDFTGNGGDAERTIEWTNSLSTAEYNADITAGQDAVFQMIVRDSEQVIVLDRSLFGATEPDSFSGVTQSGTPGTWTVTIILTDFDGDGSYSLSEGD